jgi:hypothetical protein
MTALLFTPVVLSLLVLAAHFLRGGESALVSGSLALLALLFVRRPWAARLLQLALALGAVEWAITLVGLARYRAQAGEPATRMAIILGAVAAVTLGSALLVQARRLRMHYGILKDEPADGS